MTSAAAESRLFVRCKAIGLVTSAVPFALHFLKSTRSVMVYCAVDDVVHKYLCSNMALVSVSDPFPETVRRLATDDRFLYVAYGNHVAVTALNGPSKCVLKGGAAADIDLLLPFGHHLLAVDSDSHVTVWDVDSGKEYLEFAFDEQSFGVTAVCHPLTYLNKVLFGSKQGTMRLINLKTNRLVYEFSAGAWSSPVTVLEQSPALDVVAAGLADGRIFLHNLKFDETLFSLRQDCGPVTAIVFRTDDSSSMISGSTSGRLLVWDLEKRCLDTMMETAHDGAVVGMATLPHEPIIVTSGRDNALKTWAFDASAGAPRLLLSKQGNSRPPNVVRFHAGSDLVLVGGEDATLKLFDVADQRRDKNMGTASFVRRKEAKKRRLDFAKRSLSGVVYLDSTTVRESSWDNVACCHRDSAFVTSWTTRRCRLGAHKFRHPRFKNNFDLRSACALCCRVSPCGNFVLIGYSSGHLDVFNIQSGIYRGSLVDEDGERAHKLAVNAICVTASNQIVITGCNGGILKTWRFSSKKLLLKETLDAGVVRMVLHEDVDLLGVALADFSLLVYDVLSQVVVRRFVGGHTYRITDICFSQDAHWMLSASLDCTVKVWDLPSGSLVDVLTFSRPCCSMAFSPGGQYLATTHCDKRGVYLWANKTVYSLGVVLKALPFDYDTEPLDLPRSTEEDVASDEVAEASSCDEGVCSVLYTSPRQLDSSLVSLSDLPSTRWAYLLDLKTIKERSKPKEPPKKPIHAPFFLPTVPGLVPKWADLDQSELVETNDVSKSKKILTFSQLQLRSRFAEILEQCGDDCWPAFDVLTQLGPSKVYLELANLSPVNGGSEQLMTSFLRMIKSVLNSRTCFELANSYLGLFLQLHNEAFWTDRRYVDALDDVARSQTAGWQRVDQLFIDCQCLLKLCHSALSV